MYFYKLSSATVVSAGLLESKHQDGVKNAVIWESGEGQIHVSEEMGGRQGRLEKMMHMEGLEEEFWIDFAR